MNGWVRCKLGDVLTLQRGFDLPERERRDGTVPIVSSSGITGYHHEAKVKAPGVVTGRYGTLGEVFYITEPFWPLNTALFVKDFKGNDERFVSYLLRTLSFGRQNAAGAVPGVNRNHLHALDVTTPDRLRQRRIADVLSAYDDLIENNTKRIKLLEEMARALYREWFMELRFPGRSENQLREEELPSGWSLHKLGAHVELAYGKALKETVRIAGQVPVYGSSGIVGTHNEHLVVGPGIIIGRKGNVGSVHWSTESFYPIDTVYFVKTRLSMHYVYFNLKNQNFLNNDSAVPGLNREQAYALPLLVPPASLLDSFTNLVAKIFDQTESLRKRNTLLRRTRDFLLPRLLSGEVDVSRIRLPDELPPGPG
jgi:type I restriction enzyme S subunit